ncbi:MAG: glycosyltransferase [Rubricoccaceae bacterium]|nr:glycosyltransferase [Rubricoccaceae bacterium]
MSTTPHTPRWEVVHLDLRTGLADLLPREDVGGLFLVFWWGEVPLGQHEVPAEALPLPASRLATLAAEAVAPAAAAHLDGDPLADLGLVDPPDLEALDDRLALRGADAAAVSVIVCTLDRPASLARTLASLARQSHPPREVLVVDNAPASGRTRPVVDGVPGVRYVPEPRPGLSAARNAGLRAAAGPLLAFTDDDVEVHPGWVARLSAAFADPAVDAVTGLVLPAALETEAQLGFQRSAAGFGGGYRPRRFDAAFFAAAEPRGVPVWEVGAGANMAFRSRVFARHGGFDERLGAGASGCSEDSELWYRILAEGGVCRYEPAAVVFHHHRRDLAALRRQMRAYLRGHVSALFAQYGRYRHGGSLRRALLTLPRDYARQIARRFAGGPDDRTATLSAEVAGLVEGLLTGWRYLPTRTADVQTRSSAASEPAAP